MFYIIYISYAKFIIQPMRLRKKISVIIGLAEAEAAALRTLNEYKGK